MAGRGPQPKDPSRRARRNTSVAHLRVVVAEPTKQPALPAKMPGGYAWPARTRGWWKMWATSPLAKEFTATDWSELLDCAVLHGYYWLGDVKVAPELRLRVAKFGATPEDRARLRITFAAANDAETGKGKRGSKPAPSAGASTRARRGGLKAVPSPGA